MNEVALEHRAARVSLANGVSTLMSVGIQLVSVPVCLHYWGKETYGGWLALLSAYLLLRGLDSGYGAYVGNQINYLYHRSAGALRTHLSSALFGVLAIGMLQIAIAAATLVVDPLSAWLGMPAAPQESFGAKLGLVTLMAAWVVAGSYFAIGCRLLIPAGHMYQSTWWAMAFPISQFAVVIIAALLRLSLLATSALFALSQVMVSVATALYVRRVLPQFSPWLEGASARVGFGDLRRSLPLTGSNLVQQGSTNGSVLLIAVLGGPVAVAMFTTVRTLTTLWISLTTMLSAPLLPDVVRLHARGETDKLVAINRAYLVLAGAVINIGTVASYPLIPYLYARWTAHAVALDQPLLCLLLASVVVSNIGALMALHLNGINSLRIVLAASVARAVFGLGCGALGFARMGLASFGFGILLGEIVATLITARSFVRHEIEAKGSRMPVMDLGPVALGTGAAITFFVGAGSGLWSVGYVWLAALACAALSGAWGWRGLDPELRVRLKGLPSKLFGG